MVRFVLNLALPRLVAMPKGGPAEHCATIADETAGLNLAGSWKLGGYVADRIRSGAATQTGVGDRPGAGGIAATLGANSGDEHRFTASPPVRTPDATARS
jgi:hypothetical protein